jgi:hypothetical protein
MLSNIFLSFFGSAHRCPFTDLGSLHDEVRYISYGFITLGLVSLPIGALGYAGQKLAIKAKVTIDEARAIALKAPPGSITDEELEKEKGGSGLRYSST